MVCRSIIEAVRSGEAPHTLVQEIVNYVNYLNGKGLYRRDEIPQEAIQAFHADYYLAQVKYGGHSQFIHNSKNIADFAWPDARAALEAMGANNHLTILEKMLSWVEQNPDKADQQSGFSGGRDPYLDGLDDEFFKLNRAAPLTSIMAAWIMQWPSLQIVEDEKLPAVLDSIVQMSPDRADRLARKRIATISHQINDWLQIGIGMAATACDPPIMRVAIGPGSTQTVEGEDQIVWAVRTNAGQRYGLMNEEGASIYELVPPNTTINIHDKDDLSAALKDGRIRNYKGSEIGKRCSFVPAEKIAGTVSHAARLNAAIAVDTLLRKAGIEAEWISLAPLPLPVTINRQDLIQWLILTDKHDPLIAVTQERASALLEMKDNTELAKISADFIASQAQRYGV